MKGDYLEVEEMDYYAINALIKGRLDRKLGVVGAAIESDAHTVGIDAIMNMKGFAGNYGLERYPEMDALNMGSQVPCAQLLKTALERDADAILVSQIVTQKNIHVQHLTQLIELLEAEGVRERSCSSSEAPDQQRVRQGTRVRRRLWAAHHPAGGRLVPRPGGRAAAGRRLTR